MKVRVLIYLYSIVFSIIGAVYYFRVLILEFDTISLIELISFYLVACMYSLLVITNIGLIINKSYLAFSLKYNIFFYSTQIFHFNLFGLNYEFSSGSKAAIYFVLYDGFFIEFKMDIIKFAFGIVYPAISSGIFIGMNFISVLLVGLYFYIFMKHLKLQ